MTDIDIETATAIYENLDFAPDSRWQERLVKDIAEAIASEREACAKIAEGWWPVSIFDRDAVHSAPIEACRARIASIIRARATS